MLDESRVSELGKCSRLCLVTHVDTVMPLAGMHGVGDEFVLAMEENFFFTQMLST